MTAKKPAALRQNRATKDRVVELVVGDAAEVPAPSGNWLPATVQQWEQFWSDAELVSIVRESQRPTLTRLFDLRDRQARCWALAESLRAAVGDEHFTTGSTGQVKANPLYDRADKAEAMAIQLETKIVALEDRFGLAPGSMFKLGVDFQRRESLAQANARYQEASGGSSHARRSEADDPRSLPGDSAVGSA